MYVSFSFPSLFPCSSFFLFVHKHSFPSSFCSLLPLPALLVAPCLSIPFFAWRCSILSPSRRVPSIFCYSFLVPCSHFSSLLTCCWLLLSARLLSIALLCSLVADSSPLVARCWLRLPTQSLPIAHPCLLAAHCSSVLARYSLLPIASARLHDIGASGMYNGTFLWWEIQL